MVNKKNKPASHWVERIMQILCADELGLYIRALENIFMRTIPIERIKYEIVSSANEDMSGLYEVIWALNSLYPAITKTDKINHSKPAIIELLQRDIIDLYSRNWNTQVEEKIEKTKALEIVMQDASWKAPSDEINGEYYCFLATGEKTLEEENKLFLQVNGG